MKNLLSAVCLAVGINSDVSHQQIIDPKQSVLEENKGVHYFPLGHDSNPKGKQLGSKTHNDIDDSYWLCQANVYRGLSFIAVPSPYVEHPVFGIPYKALFDNNNPERSITAIIGNKHGMRTWNEVEDYYTIQPGVRHSELLDFWCRYSLGHWIGATKKPEGREIIFSQRPNTDIESFNMVTSIFATELTKKEDPKRLRWTSFSVPKVGTFHNNPLKMKRQVAFFTVDRAVGVKIDEDKIIPAGKKKN